MRRAVVAALLLLAAPARAVLPDEMLADPALEARARTISAGLRCVVCQNQSIDDSDAPLAHDLRVLVRARLTAGDSDAAATRFLVDRYGSYILLKPPVEPATLALWLAPALFVAVGGAGIAVAVARRARRTPPPPLTDLEATEVAALLRDNDA